MQIVMRSEASISSRGLPPADILEDVARAWRAAGLSVHERMEKAMTVTNEFVYTHGVGDTILERIAPRQIAERTVHVRHRDLPEVVNPQPEATKVIRKLLTWIEAVDLASQCGEARPEFTGIDGEPIFPGDDSKWWLTDMQQRKKPSEYQLPDEDGPASENDDQKTETDDEDPPSADDCSDAENPLPGYTQVRPFWAEASERPSVV